ncbi:DUF4433 domain-containing protein (plasmid) [Tistrella mobilis]|uniref:type II toxin-antitoxin system toxin DNA ADP-ribosyl transferase DarT n=1 Tax=Tistrella mobilis TaxID=171437 RepID=UPI0035565C26
MPQPPVSPKIYHIVHVDRLASIIQDGVIWSDAEVQRRRCAGTTIGMGHIKRRRLEENWLNSHPELTVGQCTPFYFCPRSVMLYAIHRQTQGLSYAGGQDPIIHLKADLQATVQWAEANRRRWAFTDTNAGSRLFNDWCDLDRLDKIRWDVINARNWSSEREWKQAEFLIEHSFPWSLVSRIGVKSQAVVRQVANALPSSLAPQGANMLSEFEPAVHHRPKIEIRADWYY